MPVKYLGCLSKPTFTFNYYASALLLWTEIELGNMMLRYSVFSVVFKVFDHHTIFIYPSNAFRTIVDITPDARYPTMRELKLASI